MFDLNAALSAWLTATLTTFSLAIWTLVPPLAGGPEGPLWRWVLVEQGLFVLWLFIAGWWTRMVLGLAGTRRNTQHWGTAAVFACVFSLAWSWYGVTAAHAMALGLHPRYGWEWTFFTWGAPLLIAGGIFPAAGFLVHLGIALGIGAGAILALGRLWAHLPGLRLGGVRRSRSAC